MIGVLTLLALSFYEAPELLARSRQGPPTRESQPGLLIELDPIFSNSASQDRILKRGHMYKVAWFARFPQGMENADARRYWAEVHAPMCVRAPGIERYVQNHVTGRLPLESGVPDEEAQFDGYSCGWWLNEDEFRRTMASPEWAALVADGPNVFDMAWLEGMSARVEEHTIVDGPVDAFKVVWVVRFKPGIDPDEAHEYWKAVHGPIVAGVGMFRYVQNHVRAAVGGGGEARDPLRFDGFSECWFADEQAFHDAITSDAWARLVADGPNVFETDTIMGATLDERVIKPGDPALLG